MIRLLRALFAGLRALTRESSPLDLRETTWPDRSPRKVLRFPDRSLMAEWKRMGTTPPTRTKEGA